MEDVQLSLSSDEALVLLELLSRWQDGTPIDNALHPGEQVAMWNLSSILERVLVEPFSADYAQKVTEARARLAGG